jgi:uncharacterized membrane protein YeaQ/YmgE (transglycosylase-associated protein family)
LVAEDPFPGGEGAINAEDSPMHVSSQSLLIILLVGLIAGWLAGQIVRGTGFGIIGDLIIGVLGAFIGSWLLPQLGIPSRYRPRFGDPERHDRRAGPVAGHPAGARPRRLVGKLGLAQPLVITPFVPKEGRLFGGYRGDD